MSTICCNILPTLVCTVCVSCDRLLRLIASVAHAAVAVVTVVSCSTPAFKSLRFLCRSLPVHRCVQKVGTTFVLKFLHPQNIQFTMKTEKCCFLRCEAMPKGKPRQVTAHALHLLHESVGPRN